MTNIAMERSTMFKNGKPSISIRATKKPWQIVSHNQRVYHIKSHQTTILDPIKSH